MTPCAEGVAAVTRHERLTVVVVGKGGIYRRPTRRRHRLGAAVAELVVTQAVDHQQHIALRLRYFGGQPGLETGRRGPTRQPQLELGRQVEQTASVV